MSDIYDDDNSGRDHKGRGRKGHSPHPNGRPRKKPEVSQADANCFNDAIVDALIEGKPAKLTRHELLLHKMYEQALKGSVLIQRKLLDRCEKSDDTIEEGEFHLRHLGKQIIAHHDKTGKNRRKILR